MTASRICRACGADLSGEVMWCLRCYEPIRQLTPRDRGEPTIAFLHDPDEGVERSRWRAGVNTFGPVGRVVVTLIVVAFAPWSTNLVAIAVAWPAYLVLAVIVLRATWRKDHVVPESISQIATMGRPSSAPVPPAATPLPRSTIVAYGAGAILVVAGAVVWGTTGDDLHAALLMCGTIGSLVLAARWLAKP